jgi:hypothetical protein
MSHLHCFVHVSLTMPGWVGRGVSTPFPALAVVVVDGGVDLLAELVATGFGEIVNVEGVGTVDDGTGEAELEVGAGAGTAGSSVVSMQYDFPTTRLSQVAFTDGFYMSCQCGHKYIEAAEFLPIDETFQG